MLYNLDGKGRVALFRFRVGFDQMFRNTVRGLQCFATEVEKPDPVLT